MPPAIQSLLAVRLDRLPDGERRVLERAAVIGRLFARGGLAASPTNATPPGSTTCSRSSPAAA